MASLEISSHGGQRVGATAQACYCFDCDRTLSIITNSDSGLVCPICGHVVLEEFETPSSPTSPPPPRSTTVIDPRSFFPTSDTDSDFELSDSEPILPPPPPPFPFFVTTPTTSTGGETVLPHTDDFLRHLEIHSPFPPPLPQSSWDFYFESEVRHLRPPPPAPPLPLVSVIGRNPPCPRFPVPSASTMENDATQYGDFESELDALQPPPPPPLPPEHLLRSPPLLPSTSNVDSEIFHSPATELEEETPNQPLPQSPPSAARLDWDYFFQLDSPNHQSALELQPPPPPPWMQVQPLAMVELLDMRMTEELVSDWQSHQCSVCIDDFELNQKVKLTPCNHLYHSDCLLRWLDLQRTCPVCRCKLPYH